MSAAIAPAPAAEAGGGQLSTGITELINELKVHFFKGTLNWGPPVGKGTTVAVVHGEKVAVPHTISLFSVSNYMFYLAIAFVLTMAFFLIVTRRPKAALKSGDVRDLVPTGVYNATEALVDFVRNSLVVDVIGKEGLPYFPVIATFFFFILFNNLIGLVPGFKAGTGTMGTTVTWAIVVFTMVTVVGIRKKGLIGFVKSFAPSGVNVAIAAFVWVLEFFSYLIRPITHSVRLFANLFAGHIVLGLFSLFTALAFQQIALSSVVGVVTFPLLIVFYAFEVFVALIQAYVFCILTAVYLQGALALEH